MEIALLDYFRFPEQFAELGVNRDLSSEIGFFQFGEGITCYGQCAGGAPARGALSHHLMDTLHGIRVEQGGGSTCLSISRLLSRIYGRVCS